jgi:hypothetical protein
MRRRSTFLASPGMLLSAALALALATGCGDSGTIARSEASKLKSGIAHDLGEDMAQQIADAWIPVLAAAAERDFVAGDQDFTTLHAALLHTAAEYSHAVDATIRLLNTAPDQSWRHKMFADAAMGDSGGAAAVPATSFRESFPNPATSEKFDWAEVVVEPWFCRQALEHPRQAGELARALVGMQTDSARFQLYFAEAIGSQAMKAMGEAYDGFKNGGKPAASDAKAR